MSLPVAFKLASRKDFVAVSDWLLNNNMFANITYDWITLILTFEHEHDALAFSLAFGVSRHETKLEQMIKYENS